MRVVMSVAVLVGLLAGCLEGTPEPDRVRLADLTGCDVVYADGTPVDCDEQLAQAPEAAPPEGWDCWDRHEVQRRTYEAYTDRQGNWGIAYDLTANPPQLMDETPMERFVVIPYVANSDGKLAFAPFLDDQPPKGFVRVPGTWELPPPMPPFVSRGEEYSRFLGIDMFGFSTEGTHDAFATPNLDVRVSSFEDRPWLLYAFPDEAVTYHVRGGDPWATGLSGLLLKGQDFELTVKPGRFAPGFTPSIVHHEPMQALEDPCADP